MSQLVFPLYYQYHLIIKHLHLSFNQELDLFQVFKKTPQKKTIKILWQT